MTFFYRLKNALWRVVVVPVFPYVRSVVVMLGLLRRYEHRNCRQRYRLGWITNAKSAADFIAYIKTQGFRNHFVAWVDEGELASLRRLDGRTHQYHVRVFNDGEVRGHYEFTPERHPIRHLTEDGEEERRDEFLKFLGDGIIPDTDPDDTDHDAGNTNFHSRPVTSRGAP